MNEKFEDFKEEAGEMAENGREAIKNGIDQAESNVENLTESGSGRLVPYVLGALGIGIVIGLFLQREKPTNRLLDGRLEELREILGTFKKRVSSTAEDSYDDVSSALTGVVKKARKRFNLS